MSLDYKVAVCADAVNGANRFSRSGHAQADLKPSTSTFLAAPAAAVLEGGAQGASGSSTQRQPAVPPPDEPEGVMPACTTALSCNREKSHNTRAELDICGIVGIVCVHGVPALGCMLPMNAPENHSFYDLVFRELFRKKSNIGQVYLDLMCRYSKRLRALLEKLEFQENRPFEAAVIMLLVPWMHAFDHDLSCQLTFSGLYAEGAGRRIGEQTEHLWAATKPFAKRARYMTLRNWWDSYNALFRLLTFIRQRDSAAVLERKIKNNLNKISKFQAINNFFFNAGAAAAKQIWKLPCASSRFVEKFRLPMSYYILCYVIGCLYSSDVCC